MRLSIFIFCSLLILSSCRKEKSQEASWRTLDVTTTSCKGSYSKYYPGFQYSGWFQLDSGGLWQYKGVEETYTKTGPYIRSGEGLVVGHSPMSIKIKDKSIFSITGDVKLNMPMFSESYHFDSIHIDIQFPTGTGSRTDFTPADFIGNLAVGTNSVHMNSVTMKWLTNSSIEFTLNADQNGTSFQLTHTFLIP